MPSAYTRSGVPGAAPRFFAVQAIRCEIGGAIPHLDELSLCAGDAAEHLSQLHITPADGSQVAQPGFRDRQGDPSGRQQLHPLIPEAKRMHGELGVVAMGGHQLGPVRMRPRRPRHRRFLSLQVADEPIGNQARDKPVGVVDQFRTHLVAEDDFLIGYEQQQQDRRIAVQRQPGPFAS
jgi:hypothetical protein